MKKRLAVYNNQQPEGPYHFIIMDWDWWKDNWPRISEWFDQNAPETKPSSDDSMFKLETCDQYTLWRMVWDNH